MRKWTEELRDMAADANGGEVVDLAVRLGVKPATVQRIGRDRRRERGDEDMRRMHRYKWTPEDEALMVQQECRRDLVAIAAERGWPRGAAEERWYKVRRRVGKVRSYYRWSDEDERQLMSQPDAFEARKWARRRGLSEHTAYQKFRRNGGYSRR